MTHSWKFAVVAAVLACPHQALAQQATVEGYVHDSLGRPIAGASVVLQGPDGKAKAHVTSDGNGHFAFDTVAAGTYAVVATKSDYEEGSAIVSPGPSGKFAAELVLPAQTILNMTVVANRLNEARNELSPQTGTSAYTFDAQAVKDLPQGASTPLNQVLEQAPGVAQDSFGQIHIRGEHANLQYRLNGILLPEGISGFGQVLDARIIDRMQLLTGALPAQYGYRTAGVVDMQTKSGAFDQGGVMDLYGGSHATLEPSVTYSGNQGNVNYFMAGDFLSSEQGIESPTGKTHPLHDDTDQGKGFGYVEYLLNPTNRIDIIFGTSVGQFQIPNNPGQNPVNTVAGAPSIPSASLTETQLEQSHYGTIALQGTSGDWGYQFAPYLRYSQIHFRPDTFGDLQYNGIASNVIRSDVAAGLQNDNSYRVNDRHTLRAGFVVQHDAAAADNNSQVFAANPDGTQASTTPITVIDNHHKEGMLAGVYLQDEWKLTERLTVNYGARFDQLDAYLDENQISPRLGAVYKATDATTLHAGYARTFTPPPLELIAPTTVAAFNGTTGQAASLQADPVKAERSHSFDAGITHKLNDQWQLGLDSYYKIDRNLLDEGQFGQALVFTPFNYRFGRIYGAEATASYTTEKLTGYGNLALSRAMGKDIISGQNTFSQDELDYIATHMVHLDHDQTFTGSVGASYQVLEDTKVSIDGIYGSGLRSGFANTGHLPFYQQYNLGLTQHLPVDDKGVDVRFAVVNLLDSKYELRDGTGIGVGAPQWGPRLGLFMGLSRKF